MKIVFNLKVEIEFTNAKEALKALKVECKDMSNPEALLDAALAEGKIEMLEDLEEFIKGHKTDDFKVDGSLILHRV